MSRKLIQKMMNEKKYRQSSKLEQTAQAQANLLYQYWSS